MDHKNKKLKEGEAAMMDYEAICKEQKSVDKEIRETQGLVGVDISQKEILALIVEYGEFAQAAQKKWKYWKATAKTNRGEALKEFVDGVHFFASLAIQSGWESELHVDGSELVDLGVSLPFGLAQALVKSLHHLTNAFNQPSEKRAYAGVQFREAWTYYLAAGIIEMRFTEKQIQDAYFKKAKENHVRQETGY